MAGKQAEGSRGSRGRGAEGGLDPSEAPSGGVEGPSTPRPSEGGGVEGSRGANFFRGVLRYKVPKVL